MTKVALLVELKAKQGKEQELEGFLTAQRYTECLIGAQKWSRLKSIGMVESQREIDGKVSLEQR